MNYSLVLKKRVSFPISYLYGTLLGGTLEALRRLGVWAELRNTTDVVFKGRKVSGTAGSIRWDVLFLHGSILVDANLKRLKSLLRTPKRVKLTIDPVKYRVANLTDFVDAEHKDVVSSLIHGYSRVLSSEYYLDRPTGEEIKIAKVLHRWRYSRGDWNMKKALRINEKEIEGRIKEILN